MVVSWDSRLAAFPPFGGMLKTPLGRFLALVAYPAYSLIMDYISEIFVISRKRFARTNKYAFKRDIWFVLFSIVL